MASALDLSDVAVVDVHCHAVERRQDIRDVGRWRAYFSESPDPSMRTQDAAQTAYYRRLVTAAARWHGVPAEEGALLAARAGYDAASLTGRLFQDAGIAGLVIDTGHPDPASALSVGAIAEASGCQTVSLLRLELAFQELVASVSSFGDLCDAVRDLVTGVRGQGYAGVKSVVAYRTGLALDRWPRADAAAAFDAARREVEATGAVRLGHKPLLDTLLHLAFEVAAQQELPVQFHIGYGDPDVDLRTANPLLLRPLFENPDYRAMPVVLLHGCWPFVREGAFLAAVYGNAHLDLSYGIPFLSRQEMRTVTRAALGAAPVSKLLYSSDGSRVPEIHWLSAYDGRRLLGEVLAELVDDGDLTLTEARAAGERVLGENARSLYAMGERP